MGVGGVPRQVTPTTPRCGLGPVRNGGQIRCGPNGFGDGGVVPP